MFKFLTNIEIIGVNPYVLLPEAVLQEIFIQAGRDKGPIPVKASLDGHSFKQTLVYYSGKWRLYLNGEIRKTAGKDVGDKVDIQIAFDPVERITTMHPKLKDALEKNENAFSKFDTLSPSLQKEIMRYINNLKTESSIDKNVLRAIRFLLGEERFIGRDRP